MSATSSPVRACIGGGYITNEPTQDGSSDNDHSAAPDIEHLEVTFSIPEHQAPDSIYPQQASPRLTVEDQTNIQTFQNPPQASFADIDLPYSPTMSNRPSSTIGYPYIDLTLDDDDDDESPMIPFVQSSSVIKEEDRDEFCITKAPEYADKKANSNEVIQYGTTDNISANGSDPLGLKNEHHDNNQLRTPDNDVPHYNVENPVNNDDQSNPDVDLYMKDLLQEYTNNTGARQSTDRQRSTSLPILEQLDHDACGVDSEEEDFNAQQDFERQRKAYNQRKDNGLLTDAEEILFMRAKADEQSRLRRVQTRNDFKVQQLQEEADAANSFFLPELPASPDVEMPTDTEDNIEQVSARTKSSSPVEVMSDSDRPKKKRGRPKKSKTKAAQDKVAGNSRVKKPASRAKKGDGHRNSKKKDDDLLDFKSIRGLFHNDIIGQAQANQNQDAQPMLGGGKNKQKALLALIASLPAEERDLNKGDKKRLEEASRLFSTRGAMKADGEKGWKLKGMESHLHHYQMLGVSWMRDRENKGNPKGGILADTMGFGKTVISLANIIDGKPPTTWRQPKATLIVAPSNLLSQWLTEIGKHVEKSTFRDIILYRSGSRLICSDPVRTLGDQDIVITSYNEVMRSMPRNDPPSSLTTAKAKEEWWKQHFEDNRGPLHMVNWFRIVLDEAQAIKNYKSMTSEAVRALVGRYRWCLTAVIPQTPIQNSLEEFYPFMNFLREEHAGMGSFTLFKSNYCRLGSTKAMQRLQVTLNKVMLRRTHDAKLFNRPVLQLPPISPVKTIEVKFNVVERAIYQIVRARFMNKVRLINVGGAGAQNHAQNYQHMFVLLLRLRQLVGHPLLIQKTLKELMEREDIERLWSLTKNSVAPQVIDDDEINNNDGNQETIQALRAALVEAQNNTTSTGSSTIVSDNLLSINFRKYLQSLHDDGQWAKANERSLCHSCGNPPENPHLTPCMHLYCLYCLNGLWFTELQNGNGKASCLECGTSFDKIDAFQAKGFDEVSASRSCTPSKRKTADTADENIDWFNIPGPILRSAKVKGAIQQVKDWFRQDKNNKIIIFVQFRGLMSVMSRVLREEKIKHVKFDGSMSFDARDEAIQDFSKKNSTVPILLAAMKAGGVGLNLTAANRVMILDLWWNELTESQAFCRAYRIGQTRDVEVVRFVVKNSIDTDLLRMQERKTKEIDTAMQEKNRPKLTIKELLELFSDKADDSNPEANPEDVPFVFPNDPYENVDDENDDIEMTGTN